MPMILDGKTTRSEHHSFWEQFRAPGKGSEEADCSLQKVRTVSEAMNFWIGGIELAANEFAKVGINVPP
jgi:hypothetical protein